MAQVAEKKAWRWSPLLGAVLAMASFVPTGCDSGGNPFVVSFQPFYTEIDLEADSRLNGTWSDQEGDVTFSFEQGSQSGKEKEYKMKVTEKDGTRELSGEFDVRVLRLGSSRFLDIYPNNNKEGSEFYRVHFIRAHTIARLEIKQDSMQLAFLSGSWLKAKLDEKSVDTPHLDVDGSLVVTGTTEQAQELVSLHAYDDEAFSDPVLLEKQPVAEEKQ